MVGRAISHYKVLSEVGRGGMGVVYKAEDTKLKRLVSLKFLRSDILEDEEHKEPFLREAQASVPRGTTVRRSHEDCPPITPRGLRSIPIAEKLRHF